MAFRELSQTEIFGVPQQKKVEETIPKSFEDIIKSTGEQTLGVSRGLTQGASFGQAPHLAGITNELANLPKKYKSISSINDIKKLYQNIGKDYVKGREQFKKEYEDWADKNKGLAIGSELVGGLAD